MTLSVLFGAFAAAVVSQATNAYLPPLLPADNSISSVGWIRDHIHSENHAEIAAVSHTMVAWIDTEIGVVHNDLVQTWVHTEFFREDAVARLGFRSTRALYEYDCATNRARTLRHMNYSGTDLTGEPEIFDVDTPWNAVVPGSASEEVFLAACGGFRFLNRPQP